MKKPQGPEGFEEYYATQFPDNWQELKAGLLKETKPILRFSVKNKETLERLWQKNNLTWQTLSWYPHAIEWPAEILLGEELPGYADNLFYVMNASSLLPILALDPRSNERILDACAAPGGKTLAIADTLGDASELIANDTSPKRRRRLQDNLRNYGHDEVQVTGKKSETLFKTQPDTYDKILVDAPCSSEKHVLNSPKHIEQWSYSRIKSLKQRQIALLSGLFLALKPGGRMVYSTCALTPEEDEEVVKKLLKKKKDAISLISMDIQDIPGKQGEFGWRVYPSATTNLDPMFVAIFIKNS